MKRQVSFFLALALLLTSCGGGSGAAAATMHLKRTEGTVGVADGEGKALEPRENLGLYSGYGVDTQAESYAWIDLDEAKLTKLDQNSEVTITREGEALEIAVKSGALFFNVTEPLDENESMDIRCSTMMIGIRGTCGWVTDNTAALLEGVVTVTAGEQFARVAAGTMAVLREDGTLEVVPLTAAQVPAFVRAELEEDSALAEAVKADSGIDVLAPVDPIRLRDMYTYSRSLSYWADGKLILERTFFPDELGRIGKMVVQDRNKTVFEYVYNDGGTLSQAILSDGTVVSVIVEDTPDHRTIISPEYPDEKNICYYDEQGRSVRTEHIEENNLSASDTYTYDAEGKLIRMDCYDSSGKLTSYILYEYD